MEIKWDNIKYSVNPKEGRKRRKISPTTDELNRKKMPKLQT